MAFVVLRHALQCDDERDEEVKKVCAAIPELISGLAENAARITPYIFR